MFFISGRMYVPRSVLLGEISRANVLSPKHPLVASCFEITSITLRRPIFSDTLIPTTITTRSQEVQSYSQVSKNGETTCKMLSLLQEQGERRFLAMDNPF